MSRLTLGPMPPVTQSADQPNFEREAIYDPVDAETLLARAPPWSELEIRKLREEIAECGPESLNGMLLASIHTSVTGNRAQARLSARSLFDRFARFDSNDPWWKVSGFANAAFYALDFELLDKVLTRWIQFPAGCRVGMAAQPPDRGLFYGFYWRLLEDGNMTFHFNPAAFGTGVSFRGVDRSVRSIPLLVDIAKGTPRSHGQTFVNWSDEAKIPGLGFCARSSKICLLPDFDFITSHGWRDFKKLSEQVPAWEAREARAMWRGTLWPILPGGWRKQLRAQLCELSTRDEYATLLDAAFMNCRNAEDVSEVRAAGLMRPAIAPLDSARFKYLIDIDGYSSAWSGLFRKLCTGSAVLKVASDYRQWYYERLVPWENYVPVAPALDDLREKIQWLKDHDEDARRIGERGRALAFSMTYEEEVARVRPAVFRTLEADESAQ